MSGDYNLECLYTACLGFAPNQEVHWRFRKLRHELEEANEPPISIAKALASALLDGLQHGNWPNG
jgi:hypothetical protein